MMGVGVILFIVLIIFSVICHEFGHYLTAKMFRMKVTEFFCGFGKRIWSFKRGETEYGFKWIPAGGYCKIVGMSPADEDGGNDPRAFWRFPAWKRLVVLVAGGAANLLLAFVALYLIVTLNGVSSTDARIGEIQSCTPRITTNTNPDPICTAADPAAPAKAAGLRDGDKVVSFDGKAVATNTDLIKAIRADSDGRTVPMVIERDGQRMTIQVTPTSVSRPDLDNPDKQVTVGALGFTPGYTVTKVGPVVALGKTADTYWSATKDSVVALVKLPTTVPKLLSALDGGERGADTPTSVIGIAKLGGDAAESGLAPVLALFASLNLFLGIFNIILPLPPLDGGHIIVVIYEKARNLWLRLRGRPIPGPVDVMKLMPVAATVIVLLGGFAILAALADVFNPIANPFR